MKVFIVDKKSPNDLSYSIPDPSCLLEIHRRSAATQSLLAQIRESKQELRCGCKPDSPARMFVRFSHDFYTVVNHPSQGQHDENCQLFSVVHGYSDRTEVMKPIEDEDDDVDRFSLHQKVSDSAPESSPQSQNHRKESSSHKESKVDKLVRHLTEKSFENCHYKGKSRSAMQALNTLIEPCKRIQFGQTKLSEWVFYGDKGYFIAMSALRKSMKLNAWNGAGRPHALCFMLCETLQFSNGLIVLDGKKFSVRNVIRSGRDTCGPYLVVLSIALNPTTHSFECYNAYVKPVLSHQLLMPVDSHYERIVAKGLIERIESSTSPFRWSLHKPLFSKADKARTTSVLPDFILKSKNQRKQVNFIEVIEVMGMLSDAAYRERKSRLTPIMSEVWRANKVSKVDPTNAHSLAQFLAEHDNI